VGGPELVFSGYSGIGKSSVINELQPVLAPLRGFSAERNAFAGCPKGILRSGSRDRSHRGTTLERLTAPANNEVQQAELLGKAMLYDKQLSVSFRFCRLPSR
jgi:hypothetical protein